MGDLDCSDLHNVANLTDTCGFVKNTSSCDIDEGFVNYTQLLYCTFSAIPLWAACIILFIWWLFMFCGLAVTADDFFCPSLAVISQSLKLSHNVAGVTFLAFGNGAPDIFSAIAAIGNAKAGDAGLAIGALFGAGVFVTAVVAGSIAIIKPFHSMQRPFLRDVIFYLAACFWAWYVMWDKQISQLEAAGFIILYIFYVIVVVIGRYINQRLKNRRNNSLLQGLLGDSVERSSEESKEPLLKQNEPVTESPANIQIEAPDLEQLLNTPKKERTGNLLVEALKDINPIDGDEWKERKIIGKIYQVFKSPLVVLLNLTVPIVGAKSDDNEDDSGDIRNWNRLLNSLQVFTGPVFAIFATEDFTKLEYLARMTSQGNDSLVFGVSQLKLREKNPTKS